MNYTTEIDLLAIHVKKLVAKNSMRNVMYNLLNLVVMNVFLVVIITKIKLTNA